MKAEHWFGIPEGVPQTWVEYHSQVWSELVEQGWTTAYCEPLDDKQLAKMIKLPSDQK